MKKQATGKQEPWRLLEIYLMVGIWNYQSWVLCQKHNLWFSWFSSSFAVRIQIWYSKYSLRTPLVVQWLRICLPMQGTRVRALVWEDPTCRGATKPVHHNYWAHVPQLLKPACLEPVFRSKEKPPQWEARAPQRRVAPARRN